MIKTKYRNTPVCGTLSQVMNRLYALSMDMQEDMYGEEKEKSEPTSWAERLDMVEGGA